MNIIIFILILGILIFVHEFGHFIFAKIFKIRVDEFGFGYPPRMFKIFRWRGTDFTMNWIPFGGFVKIFGQSDDGLELSKDEKKVNLIYKPRWQQILVMFGGILFNIIFAWVLFSSIFTYGINTSVSSAPKSYNFDKTELTLTSILENSPAEEAGLNIGDVIVEYYNKNEKVTVRNEKAIDVANFIKNSKEQQDVGFVVLRNGKIINLITHPEQGIVGDNYSIGIGLDRMGKLKLPIHRALIYGAKDTYFMLSNILTGFGQLITGKISVNTITGPVGIAKQVGQVSGIGIIYLIGFMAMLSLNLAILNLIPFPALDGGRILILMIESILRKRLNPKIVNWINLSGFLLLIIFMLVITTKDIINLF